MQVTKTRELFANAKYFVLAFNHELKAGNLTQRDIARKTGLRTSDISFWVRGLRRAGPAKQAQVAEAFGYTLPAFLALGRAMAGDEPPPPPPPPPRVQRHTLPRSAAWFKPLVSDLARLDESGRNAVKTLVRALANKKAKPRE